MTHVVLRQCGPRPPEHYETDLRFEMPRVRFPLRPHPENASLPTACSLHTLCLRNKQRGSRGPRIQDRLSSWEESLKPRADLAPCGVRRSPAHAALCGGDWHGMPVPLTQPAHHPQQILSIPPQVSRSCVQSRAVPLP